MISEAADNAGLGNGSAYSLRGYCGDRTPRVVDYPVVIVGAGPAGASLACFLTSHGIKGLMVSDSSFNTDTPRAHITNMAALECLRDIGLDEECHRLGSKGDCMTHTRWCHSMAGEEYARIHSWGNDPRRMGDYQSASPCDPCDLPQTLLEPVLVRYAALHGFKCRFDTSFVGFTDDLQTGMVTTSLHDLVSGEEYQVRSRYLFGADGARSNVVRQLQLPMYKQPSQGLAINILVKADMSHLIENRKGNLHWVMQPDREVPNFGWLAIVRMVKPWHEWMFILFPRPGHDVSTVTPNQWLKQVKAFIGDDSIAAEILNISTWNINETVAEEYSHGNVFCLGDAVHRHPPFNGLGSNTCIQDSFNLAWKVAYVMDKKASDLLLSTYSIERQPVGLSIISRANDGFREHSNVWTNIGIISEDINERKAILNELAAPTSAGTARRRSFQEAIIQTSHEFHGLGIEMGQHYASVGIYADDERLAYERFGAAKHDPVLFYEPSTYPGCRLPHAWLNKAIPSKQISTIDLAGKGDFVLFTGIGGVSWQEAAKVVSIQLDIPIRAYSIGFRQDWEDVYFEWEHLRGVSESGVVLVRPDRFVAWRAQEVLGSVDQCSHKLAHVVQTVLCLK